MRASHCFSVLSSFSSQSAGAVVSVGNSAQVARDTADAAAAELSKGCGQVTAGGAGG